MGEFSAYPKRPINLRWTAKGKDFGKRASRRRTLGSGGRKLNKPWGSSFANPSGREVGKRVGKGMGIIMGSKGDYERNLTLDF